VFPSHASASGLVTRWVAGALLDTRVSCTVLVVLITSVWLCDGAMAVVVPNACVERYGACRPCHGEESVVVLAVP
jgi:hypothetical protein